MKISDSGIKMIEIFEVFIATPYQDIDGNVTIGYGHKLHPGELYSSISEEDAQGLLGQDLLYAESVVNNNVLSNLNQNQFDALVSFVFNVGQGKPGVKDGFVTLRSGNQSTMLRCLNAGDFDGAANQFMNWDHADGVEVAGLFDRRKAERARFQMPVVS